VNQDRVMPQDRDAERGILGGILRDPDVLSDVQRLIVADNFYFDAHQKIYQALCELGCEEQPIDLVLLRERLRRNKQLEDMGGAEYLVELWEAVPTGANAVYHANLVRAAAKARALIHAANEILRDSYDRTGSADELVAQAERKLFALGADDAGGAEPCSLAQAARETMENLDARIASGDTIAGLSTGYVDLDSYTGGFHDGQMVVIAARPSVGKTALVTSIMRHTAEAGHGVLFFSVEMTRKEIASRLLSMESGVPMHRMARPRDLQREDIDALVNANTALAALPIYLEDASEMTAARIGATARRTRRRRNVRLIAIDYLGLLSAENPRDNKTLQIGTLALRMKQLARALNVPVILLSQLNRESDHERRRPRLSDLRDSGEIEQHADCVLLLHREPNLPTDDPAWPVDVIVAKNRNGPTGDFPLTYIRPVMRFENFVVGR
jgi:replicative DNA helicase